MIKHESRNWPQCNVVYKVEGSPETIHVKSVSWQKWTDDDAIAELKERKWWFTEADWSWFLLTHGHKISEVEYA